MSRVPGSMSEIKEEAHADTPAMFDAAPRIGIGVGHGLSGLYSLKWALEKKVVPVDGTVFLLHVQSPLRWIPHEMGGKFPVHKANPETVKQFKEGLALEKENLVNNYRRLCEKRKVKHTVCYSENNSVPKGLVDQVLKLGIANLVIGTSSQSLLSRALKKENIPTSVAKHAPAFCAVMVICKGKLCFVKEATETPKLQWSSLLSVSSASEISIPAASEASTSSGSIHEDDLMEGNQIGDIEGRGSSEVQDSLCSTSHPRLIHSASMDPSQTYHRRLLSESSSDAGFVSPAMTRNYSNPFEGWLSESVPATPFHPQPYSMSDYSITHSINQLQTREALSSDSTIQEGRHPADSHRDFQGRDYTSETIPPWDLAGPFSSTASSGSTSALDLLPDHDAHSPTSMDFGILDNMDSPARSMHMTTPEQVASLAPNGNYPLQSQLSGMKQLTDWAVQEVEKQACNAKMVEEVVANARTMIAEHERRWDEALKEASFAKQQAAKDAKRCEEALAALQLAARERDTLQQIIEEEVRKHQQTKVQLESQSRMVDAYAVEVATERRRHDEALANLSEVSRKLEVECELRKEAEAKLSEETAAKLQAIAALQKERRKYTEYTFEELQSATNNFHEENKLGEGGYGPVFKGKLHHTTVAIKVLAHDHSHGRHAFQSEVEVLSRIRHPHMVMLLGACPEKGCIVYEYMANGSLEDRLNCKNGTPPLPWYVRFRICLEVATALLFLHSRSEPIVHRDLKPGNILLDHHFVSKIGDVGLAKLVPNNLTFTVTMYKESVLAGTLAYIDPDYQRTGVVSCESDLYALGLVMLQLLTGQPAVGVANLVEEAVDRGYFEEVLDKSGGDWPLAEALALACLSLRCAEPKRKHRPNLEKEILPQLENIQNVANLAAASMACASASSSGTTPFIPSFFYCPISQEIMEHPHIAADGFTYELEAINTWLQTHNTSPMTNLMLNHKILTPNHTLKSAIQECYDKGLISR